MKQSDFLAAVKMVSHAAALRDIRYYLNGIFLEWDGKLLSVVGTDGHRMAVAQLNYGEELLSGPVCVIIPAEQVKLMMAAPKGSGLAEIAFPDRYKASICLSGQVFAINGIEAKYPEWRRVGPESSQAAAGDSAVSAIGFNANYVSQACAALAKVANKKYQGVKLVLRGASESMRFEADLAGDNPAIVNAYAIVRPMRM